MDISIIRLSSVEGSQTIFYEPHKKLSVRVHRGVKILFRKTEQFEGGTVESNPSDFRALL